jgi:hypothetical protein
MLETEVQLLHSAPARLNLDEGRICLSNNAAETGAARNGLGRKLRLFAGSERGGQRAAAMYSLIVTAKMNGVDPQGLAGRRARSDRRTPGSPDRPTPPVGLEAQ